MMLMVVMFLLEGCVQMRITNPVKRRDPIAFDLLTSGNYKIRKVAKKTEYRRKFRNERSFNSQYF
jgi:hypothetical protein